MVKVSDLPGGHVVDQGGGIWAGMSGSPVYVDGKLLGAVSYGFTSAPSPIGALTPATEMYDLLGLTGAAAAAPAERGPVQGKVKLSKTVRSQLAAKSATATPRGTMQRLVTPLAVGGLGPKRLQRLQADADAAGLDVKAYAAGRSRASTGASAPTARPQAGGNFAATLSSGDLTLGGIGTTTAVCGDRALAWGHPLTLAGPAHYTASDADALGIVQDDVFGSFKMANIGAPLGTVDQDRSTALRADLTRLPATADVTSTIDNRDTGKSRTGSTKIASSEALPGLVPFAVLANFDSVFDELGDGTATSEWTISGTRAGGVPFTLSRGNQWADRFDIAFQPAFDLGSAVEQLADNDFEDVTIDRVSFGASAATKFEQEHVTSMAVSVNKGKFRSPKQLRVKVGAKLAIRVGLRSYRGTTTRTTTLKMTVPKSARGQSGLLTAVGGAELAQGFGEEFDEGCFFTGQGCDDQAAGSLDAIMDEITSAPRNDTVVAQLELEPDDFEDFFLPSKPAVTKTKAQKLTVVGSRSMGLSVRR